MDKAADLEQCEPRQKQNNDDALNPFCSPQEAEGRNGARGPFSFEASVSQEFYHLGLRNVNTGTIVQIPFNDT